MKKILAIVLAAIMAFSLGVIGFAEGEEAPAFPVQTEGKVYLASEKVEVEAGQVYQIPVYLVANYKSISAVNGVAVLGFKAALTGDAAKYMNIIAITATEDTQKLATYTFLGSTTEQIAFTTTDLNIFRNEKFAIANVVVEVASDYVGHTTADDETTTPIVAELKLSAPDYTIYADNNYAAATGLTAGADMSIINTNAPVIGVEAIGVDYVSAEIAEYIPVPWNERLRNWFLAQSDKILTFLVAIFDTLAGLLPTL